MYLKTLLSKARLEEGDPAETEVAILPKGIQPWVEKNMLVDRADWEAIYVSSKASEPDIEAVFAALSDKSNREFLREFAESESVKKAYLTLAGEIAGDVDSAVSAVEGDTATNTNEATPPSAENAAKVETFQPGGMFSMQTEGEAGTLGQFMAGVEAGINLEGKTEPRVEEEPIPFNPLPKQEEEPTPAPVGEPLKKEEEPPKEEETARSPGKELGDDFAGFGFGAGFNMPAPSDAFFDHSSGTVSESAGGGDEEDSDDVNPLGGMASIPDEEPVNSVSAGIAADADADVMHDADPIAPSGSSMLGFDLDQTGFSAGEDKTLPPFGGLGGSEEKDTEATLPEATEMPGGMATLLGGDLPTSEEEKKEQKGDENGAEGAMPIGMSAFTFAPASEDKHGSARDSESGAEVGTANEEDGEMLTFSPDKKEEGDAGVEPSVEPAEQQSAEQVAEEKERFAACMQYTMALNTRMPLPDNVYPWAEGCLNLYTALDKDFHHVLTQVGINTIFSSNGTSASDFYAKVIDAAGEGNSIGAECGIPDTDGEFFLLMRKVFVDALWKCCRGERQDAVRLTALFSNLIYEE